MPSEPTLSADALLDQLRGRFEQLCQDVAAAVNRAPAGQVINASEEKVRDLLAMRASLTTLLATCEGDGPAADCPIITAFREEGRNEHTERSCEHGEGED